MSDLQQVIDEQRPMLEWFLHKVGIYQPGQRIADVQLRDRFSDWLGAQTVREEHFAWLAGCVAAFICEYLIEGHGALRFIEGEHILLRLPVDASLGVYRDLDPFSVAIDLVRNRGSLKEYLGILCDRERP